MAKYQLLYVCGQPEERTEFILSLDRYGYRVSLAESCEEARKKINQQQFDVLISDLHLPDCDGIEFCWQVRTEMAPKTVLVLLLPESNRELELNCLRSGIDLVFEAGIDFREFRIRLEALLRRFQDAASHTEKAGIQFTGSLADFPPVELIQWLSGLHRTGTLWLTFRFRRAALVFEHGEIVFARSGNLLGEKAVFDILTWKQGSFQLEREKLLAQPNVHTKTMRLLIEFLRLCDEKDVDRSSGGTSLSENRDQASDKEGESG